MKSEALAPSRLESFFSDMMELSKAQLSLLVLVTTFVGFIAAWSGPMDYLLLAATLIGTAFCAIGASALNQWWERDHDALMKRTRNRPLPARRMHPADALLFGLLISIAGLAVLFIFTNIRATFLAFATIAIYVLVYTPMKRISTLNTLVGAIPGALPPLIGWVAVTGSYSLEGSLLFAILWFWQMPHFLAIAWRYREDYAQAGYIMLTRGDSNGAATSRQAFLYTLCLVLVSLLPSVLRFNTDWYFFGALALGLGFTILAFRFMRRPDLVSARILFFGSIIYLPLLLGLLAITQR